MSLTREDRAKVDNLAARLRDLGHEVWIDKQLSGGQDWWDEVLRHIREADALVLAISPGSMRSQACAAERGYAISTRRPLLPVVVKGVTLDTLPQEVARLQIVDYESPGELSAIQLARAVDHLPPAPPGDWSHVEAPPVPFSYLSGIARELAAERLSLDDQLILVSRLETALRSPDADERAGAAALLQTLNERGDLFAEAWHRAQRLVPSDPPPPAGPQPVGSTAAIPTPARDPWAEGMVGSTPAPRRFSRGALTAVSVGALLAALAAGGAVLLLNDRGGDLDGPTPGVLAVPTPASPSESEPPSASPTPSPAPKRTRTVPRDVTRLPSGLFCRDLFAEDYSYVAAVEYWQFHGNPNQMDEDRNGIPCETVYPQSDVDAYWSDRGGSAGPDISALPPGLYCRDLYGRGVSYADAVAYWRGEGTPDRMDADLNGIPCETVYPASEVAAFG